MHGVDFDRRLEKSGATIHTSESDHWGPARGTLDINQVLKLIMRDYEQ